MLRRRDCEGIQRDTGFGLDMLEKLYHLTRILQAICSKEVLHSNLTLKGGTALNPMYLDTARISIDLDFNFTGSVEREVMKALRPKVEAAMTTLSRQLEERFVVDLREVKMPATMVQIAIRGGPGASLHEELGHD